MSRDPRNGQPTTIAAIELIPEIDLGNGQPPRSDLFAQLGSVRPGTSVTIRVGAAPSDINTAQTIANFATTAALTIRLTGIPKAVADWARSIDASAPQPLRRVEKR